MSSLQFRIEQFEHTSESPAPYNAGNRVYDRDVARFITLE